MKEPAPDKDKWCKAFGDLISPYFDGQLTDPQMNQVEAHLKECPLCARQLENYRLMRNLLNVEKLNSPVDLASTVMATVERDQLLTGLDELTSPPTGRWTKIFRTVAAAAMIFLVVYAGVLVVQFAGNNARQSPLVLTSKHTVAESGRENYSGAPAKPQITAKTKLAAGTSGVHSAPVLLARKEREPQQDQNPTGKLDDKSNQPLVLRPSTQKFTAPAEAPAGQAKDTEMAMVETLAPARAATAALETLDTQVPQPLQVRLWAPDLPAWMLLREQILEIFKQAHIPARLDPEQIPPALREQQEFYYLARKGLDLAPGATDSEFLVLVNRQSLREIRTHLQLSALDTIRQEWRPDLQKILTTQPVEPQLAALGRQTRTDLIRYFTRKGLAAMETSQPATAAASAPSGIIKGMKGLDESKEAETKTIPILFTIEMPPRIPPATTTSAPAAPTTTTSAPATMPATRPSTLPTTLPVSTQTARPNQ